MDDLSLQQLRKMYEMQAALHAWRPCTSAAGQVKYSGAILYRKLAAVASARPAEDCNYTDKTNQRYLNIHEQSPRRSIYLYCPSVRVL